MPEWLRPLLEEIEADPQARIRDSELRQRGLEPERVRRWFQRQYGMTFQAYQRGVIELAEAAAAAASYQYHSAALHKVAAGLFFSAAAFQGYGAIAGGGGGGGGSAARGYAATFTPNTQGPPTQQLTFIIQGDVVGKDEWIRDLADQVGKAVQDNASGRLALTTRS